MEQVSSYIPLVRWYYVLLLLHNKQAMESKAKAKEACRRHDEKPNDCGCEMEGRATYVRPPGYYYTYTAGGYQVDDGRSDNQQN